MGLCDDGEALLFEVRRQKYNNSTKVQILTPDDGEALLFEVLSLLALLRQKYNNSTKVQILTPEELRARCKSLRLECPGGRGGGGGA